MAESVASSPASAFASLNPCSDDNAQELRCKLIYTSLELQKVSAKGRLQESEVWRLQELLRIMTKERDDAREECRRLQERVLFQQTMPAMGVDSASSFMQSSSMVSSPSSSPWSLRELEEHLNSDDFCPVVMTPAPSELQRALESLVRSCDNGRSLSSPMKLDNERDPEQDIHVEMLDRALCFDAPPCFNRPHLQAIDESVSIGSPSVRTLSRQSSSNSSSACVQCFQARQPSPEESLDAVVGLSAVKSAPIVTVSGTLSSVQPPPPSPIGCNVLYESQQAVPIATSVPIMANESLIPVPATGANGMSIALPPACHGGASVGVHVSAPMQGMANNGLPTNTSSPCPSSTPGNNNSVAFLVNASSPLSSSRGSTTPPIVSSGSTAAVCMVPSMACLTQSSMPDVGACSPAAPSVLASSSMAMGLPTGPSRCCYQQATPTTVRQFHLPEPPEADPQVMLSSLPEKGKLLQAVMQAGPLLQTLLLAGPLPQWRHPPPPLSTRDIPKVSLAPGHVLSTPRGVQGAMGCSNGFPSSMTRKRIAIAEPCLHSKKLRKLSPSLAKKGQAVHMVSGGEERQGLASGSLTQLAAS